jgi:ATP-dependent RNA helicase DeaD
MEIFEFMPENRQTMLFSATMPPLIRKLAGKILKNPEFIKAISTDNSTNIDIDQSYYVIEEHEREIAAIRLMEALDPEKAIVFCRTKLEVDKLSTYLGARGYNAKGLHGDMEQPQRNQVMQSFRNSMIDILVATDVAARGLDVADVTHVFNYHMPFDAKSYIHRVGRTGRAGHKGKAVTLVTPSEFRTIQRIEKSVGSTIELKVIPTISRIIENKKKKLSNDIVEYTPGSEGLDLVETLSEEMDIKSIAVTLASMLLDTDKTSGPDQIGYTEKTLSDMLRRDRDRYSNSRDRNRSGSRGGSRDGRYRGRSSSSSSSSSRSSSSSSAGKKSTGERYFAKNSDEHKSSVKTKKNEKFSKRARPKNNRKKDQ